MSFWAVMVDASWACSSEQCSCRDPEWKMVAILRIGPPHTGRPVDCGLRRFGRRAFNPGEIGMCADTGGVAGLGPVGVAYAHRGVVLADSDGDSAFLVSSASDPTQEPPDVGNCNQQGRKAQHVAVHRMLRQSQSQAQVEDGQRCHEHQKVGGAPGKKIATQWSGLRSAVGYRRGRTAVDVHVCGVRGCPGGFAAET